MRYEVEVTVSEISVFYVEADSKREAEEKAKDAERMGYGRPENGERRATARLMGDTFQEGGENYERWTKNMLKVIE